MTKRNQYGFSHLMLFVALVVVLAMGFAGFRVLNSGKQDGDTKPAGSIAAGGITWAFNNKTNKWESSGGPPPDCPEPLFKNSPVDVSKVTAPLFPGQYRNGDYKAHGGFRFDKSRSKDITVKLPFDATLIGLTRYYEADEIQYVVDFLHPCGVAIRFDHLQALSPKLQAVAETTPEPKVDDSRGMPLADTIDMIAGEVVATAVGFPKIRNVGVDFGVYDYRQRNRIAENDTWRQIHRDFASQHWFGVCWFDLLPAADAAQIKSLGPTDPRVTEVSDYCSAPGGTTLEHNSGLPE